MNPRLLVLCFGNFIIGTGALIVPGMLPALANGLGVNVPVAAQRITAFAFTVCVTAPPLAALTACFDRRGLMIVPIGRAMWASLFSNRRLMLAVAVTAIQAAAQFTVLSFLVPSFKTLFNASPETISILLVAFAATGVAGNIIGARLVDQIGAAIVTLLGLISMLTAHVLWLIVPGSWVLLIAFLLLWGIGCFSTNSAHQARLVMLSPPHAPVSVAMNSSAKYFGQAVGTAAGAAVLAGIAGASAYTALAFISIPLFVVSIAVSFLAERKTGSRGERRAARG